MRKDKIWLNSISYSPTYLPCLHGDWNVICYKADIQQYSSEWINKYTCEQQMNHFDLSLDMNQKSLIILEDLIIKKIYESLGILVRIILKKQQHLFTLEQVSDLQKR